MDGGVVLYALVALVLLVVFLGVWFLDKRRSDKEEADPARRNVDNDGRGRGGRRRP